MSSASDSHRLTILTLEEVEDLYGLPRFTDDDRRLYCDLSPTEHAAVMRMDLLAALKRHIFTLALSLGVSICTARGRLRKRKIKHAKT